MKLLAHPESLTDAIVYLTNVNRLLALRTFEYPRNRPRPVLSLIYLLVLLTLYYSIMPFQSNTFISDRTLKLEYVLYQLMMYVNSVRLLPQLLLNLWYTKTFNVCCRMISEIDETLRQFGSTMKYDGDYLLTIVIILGWFLFSFFLCVIIFFSLNNVVLSFYIILSYSYGITISIMMIVEFYVFVRLLHTRFEWINRLLCSTVSSINVMNLSSFEMKCDEISAERNARTRRVFCLKPLSVQWLRQTLHQSYNGNKMKTRKNEASPIQSLSFEFEKRFQRQTDQNSDCDRSLDKCKHQLQTIKQVHLELCKVSKILCTIFGVQIACEFGMSIMLITGLFYNLYIRYGLLIVVRDMKYQTILVIMMLLFNMLKFIFLSYICKKTADEGNRTTEIVHMIYGCITDAEIQEETQQFGIQIMQSPVAFSAFGISLDNTILTSSLGAVATYLVIMIQMSNSLESNKTMQFARNI